MVPTTISEWYAYDRVLIRCFPEKMNAKSPFSVLVIAIFLVFFRAYIGVYRTPAGWYGQ